MEFFRENRVFILVLLFLLLCGSGFVALYVDPVLNNAACTPDDSSRVQCHNQIADVFRYYRFATQSDMSSWFQMFQDTLSGRSGQRGGTIVGGIGLTNIFIFFIILAGQWLVPWAPFLGIFLLQLLSLPLLYLAIRRIAWVLDPQLRDLYYTCFLFSPMLLASILAANKEYWSVFFVTLMAACALDRRRILLLVLATISLAVREINFPVGIFFFLLTFRCVRFWHLAVLLSLAIPVASFLIPGFNNFRLVWSQWSNQGASVYLGPIANLQNFPLGHLLATPIVLGINILGPGFGPDARASLLDGVMGIYGLGNSLTSYLYIIFGGQALYACWKRKLWNHPLVSYAASVAILTAILPLNQFRYYYPMWPFLLAVALMAPRKAAAPMLPDSGQEEIPSSVKS